MKQLGAPHSKHLQTLKAVPCSQGDSVDTETLLQEALQARSDFAGPFACFFSYKAFTLASLLEQGAERDVSNLLSIKFHCIHPH